MCHAQHPSCVTAQLSPRPSPPSRVSRRQSPRVGPQHPRRRAPTIDRATYSSAADETVAALHGLGADELAVVAGHDGALTSAALYQALANAGLQVMLGLRTGTTDQPAPLPPLDAGDDEIGQVASAFELAQQTAIDAAAAEAAARAGFSAVFLNIAHRSHVHRQLRTIDGAERRTRTSRYAPTRSDAAWSSTSKTRTRDTYSPFAARLRRPHPRCG